MNSQATVRVLDFEDYVGPSGSSYDIRHGQIIDDEYYSEYGVTVSSCNFLDGVNDSGTGPCVSPDRADFQVAFDTSETGTRDRDLEFFTNSNGDVVNRDAVYRNQNVPTDQLFKSLSDGFNHFSQQNNIDNKLAGSSFFGGPGNVLILQENTDYCDLTPGGFDSICNNPDDEGSRAAGYIDFNFDDLVTILSLDFFDVEDKQADIPNASDIQFFTIINGAEEEITGLNGGNGFEAPDLVNGGFARTFFGLSGIDNVSRLRVNLPGSGAIDNLVFHTGEPADVPAPSTLGLFALVFAGMFYSRKKAQQL
jgi:hypothetical protein